MVVEPESIILIQRNFYATSSSKHIFPIASPQSLNLDIILMLNEWMLSWYSILSVLCVFVVSICPLD